MLFCCRVVRFNIVSSYVNNIWEFLDQGWLTLIDSLFNILKGLLFLSFLTGFGKVDCFTCQKSAKNAAGHVHIHVCEQKLHLVCFGSKLGAFFGRFVLQSLCSERSVLLRA